MEMTVLEFVEGFLILPLKVKMNVSLYLWRLVRCVCVSVLQTDGGDNDPCRMVGGGSGTRVTHRRLPLMN